MPWNKKKLYNLLESADKKTTSAAATGGKYTKKTETKFHPLRAAHRPTHRLV